MPQYVTDGILYFVVLASAYYAYRSIPDNLNHIRNLAACPEQVGPGPRKQLQKDAENAISIETLRTLSDSHSYDLRSSTIKIVAARTVKSRAKQLLLKDLASEDENRRYNAICGLWMLLYNPTLQGKHIAEKFLDYSSFHALITALKNVLADHHPEMTMRILTPGDSLYPEPKLPPSPIKPPVRPSHEFSLMYILRMLLETSRPYDKLSEYPDNISCALSAGLVTRWLKDYPFPCSLPQNSKYNFKKSDVANLFERRAWAYEDELMGAIINDINLTAMGKKQLRDAGLRGPTYNEIDDIESRWTQFPSRLDDIDTDNDVRMVNGESTAGAVTPPPVNFTRRRRNVNGELQELSQEEENLRRRRREAVVVAEAGSPLGQDNILQRTDSGNAWRSNSDDDDHDPAEERDRPEPEHEPDRRGSDASQFRVLMEPLIAEEERLERLRDDVIHNQDLDSVSWLDEVHALYARVNDHRHVIEEELRRMDITEEQRDSYMSTMRGRVRTLVNNEFTINMMTVISEQLASGEDGGNAEGPSSS